MMENCNFDVILLTAAEVPRVTNVATSQVLEIAAQLSANGIRCGWFSVMPFQSLLGASRREGAIKLLAERCRQAGLEWQRTYFGSLLFDSRMLPFRKLYGWLCARLLLPGLRKFGLGPNIVINARSYYAAETALQLKVLLAALGHRVVVCYDMRGLLSLTYPASARGNKFKVYGVVKAWEAELAFASDVVYNNRIPAIELFRIEYGIEVVNLPVAGFSLKQLGRTSFDERWQSKRIAFVGSLGAKFNDGDVLHRQLRRLKALGFCPVIVTDSTRFTSSEFEVIRLDYSSMADFYSKCLAIILPGRDQPEDVFDRLALRIYTAPTKLSEALSAGVPVIVGSGLDNICKFVTARRCGVVFDIAKDQFDLPAGVSITDRSFWEMLSEGARQIGPEFSRERVMEIYLKTWADQFKAVTAPRD